MSNVFELDKPSIESNNTFLQNNEISTIQGVNNKRDKTLVRIVPTIGTPDKIKDIFTQMDSSYIRRPSVKPNYTFEKTSQLKVDTEQLSEFYNTNVVSKTSVLRPRNFNEVIEKNVLEMPPIIEKDFDPKFINPIVKIGKTNELNFTETKTNPRNIEIPIFQVVSNKTVLKRL
jgi:hypothetical protein